ncbi:MAG: ABC transporter substrate-binding protein [Bacteroidales bacterium]|nr:ABC transporter substrate-binding protein [Bacteroidales bacterium]
MKKAIIILSTLMVLLPLKAQDKVRFMPAWQPQAQFAGYYIALEKGFYQNHGLDVTIEHVGVSSSRPPVDRLESGEVDIIVSNPIQAVLARDNGLKLKNVLQVNQTTGMMVVSHTPINGPKSLEGLTVGRWKTGFNEICDIACKANGIQVNWVPFLGGINIFLAKAVDATVVMSYAEYFDLVEALGEIPEENTIRFSDWGYDVPDDGVYVTEEYLASHPETVKAFCEATIEGWQWCFDHREEAVDIVLEYVKSQGVRTNRFHQASMLNEMLNLLVDHNMDEVTYAPVPKDVFNVLVRYLVEMGFISRTITYEEFLG